MLEKASWLDVKGEAIRAICGWRNASAGPVAQWIEHLIPNQGVAGSNPAGVATKMKGNLANLYVPHNLNAEHERNATRSSLAQSPSHRPIRPRRYLSAQME